MESSHREQCAFSSATLPRGNDFDLISAFEKGSISQRYRYEITIERSRNLDVAKSQFVQRALKGRRIEPLALAVDDHIERLSRHARLFVSEYVGIPEGIASSNHGLPTSIPGPRFNEFRPPEEPLIFRG